MCNMKLLKCLTTEYNAGTFPKFQIREGSYAGNFLHSFHFINTCIYSTCIYAGVYNSYVNQ